MPGFHSCKSLGKFSDSAEGGFFAGAEGAFAGKAVEVVAAKVKGRIPGREMLAESSHFPQAARWKLRNADIPVDEVNEENFAAAFGEILFDDIAGLLLERFIAGIQTPAPRRVPEENSGHAGAIRAAIGRAQVLHFNFCAWDYILREGITSEGSARRLRERHGCVHNPGILRATEQRANFFRETGTNCGNELARNSEDDGARAKGLLLPFYFGFHLNS